MAKRKITPDESSTRLLDLWSPGEGFGPPIGCVSTTFTFDASHFEEQCLARFLAMETSPAEGARAYLIEREEKLSQVFSCVLVDQRHARDQRSLRWNLLPIRVPEGIQHAKLTILVWEKHLRVLVGSANLTEPAYRSNLETVACLDFEPSGGPPLSLVHQAIDFLDRLADMAPGARDAAGPRRALVGFIAATRQHVQSWKDIAIPAGQPRPVLVGLSRGRAATSSVLSQLSALWRGPQPLSMTVVSPFFDQTPSAISFVYGELAQRLTTRGPRDITFRCTGRKLADGSIEAELPGALFNTPERHRSTCHFLEIVDGTTSASRNEPHRALHSKAIVLENDHLSLVLIGSSNCTVKGLGLGSSSNVEMNLAYVVPSGNGAFLSHCLRSLPSGSPVDLDGDVRFLEVEGASDMGEAEAPLLPAGFDEALYDPAVGTGSLVLHFIPEQLPTTFDVYTPQGLVLLGGKAGSQIPHSTQLAVDDPVSCLKVRWQDGTGSWLSADWIVNVTDAGLLPPPSELASLNLEDLLAVLTSSRPAHWLIAERLLLRESEGQQSTVSVVDPHKKVDTSQFLMRRMRRLSHALEGLRKRLEQPLVSVEGMRWRLQGPFGPIALAKALMAESGPGAPFFVLEIAATLQSIRWPSSYSVSEEARSAVVREVLGTLKSLALDDTGDSPANLRRYVTTQLAELVP
jgi:hypothetical protein